MAASPAALSTSRSASPVVSSRDIEPAYDWCHPITSSHSRDADERVASQPMNRECMAAARDQRLVPRGDVVRRLARSRVVEILTGITTTHLCRVGELVAAVCERVSGLTVSFQRCGRSTRMSSPASLRGSRRRPS
jgi:hypothetical protein